MAAEDVLAGLDRLIERAAPGDRAGLVVALAARLAALGAGLAVADANGSSLAPAATEPLLTYREAAGLIRCSPSYVETLVRQGKLPAVRLPAGDKAGRPRDGRLVRLRASDLRAWADEHRA
jgi:excisionase family DNA binding protein